MTRWQPRLLFLTMIVTASTFATSKARSQSRAFETGSLIIPMDTDYQDEGMFQAFGLLNQLLLHDVTLYWVIDSEKELGDADFTASAVDVADDSVVIESHGYRGGPFVVDAGQAEDAMDVIEAWRLEHVTNVHRATAPFEGEVSKTMTAAPTIAVFADGEELIAFHYLNAAAIPDSAGQSWPESRDGSAEYPGYPDILDVDEIRGPTIEDDSDGRLFDSEGLPVFCQLMTMHWDVRDRDDEAIAEIRTFLTYPTHFFAECQAVNAVENSINGHFLTPNGYIMDDRPTTVDFLNVHLPFAQFDGRFETVGGSEPSYSLPEGDEYYDMGVVMITEAGSPIGTRDVWMTGYLDGECHIDPKEDEIECDSTVGKVSYLGGHAYDFATPISEHSRSQGTRLFLNSLFEADCVTSVGQPRFRLTLASPTWTPVPQFDFEIDLVNAGIGLAYNLVLTDALPDGMTYVMATPDPVSVEGGVLVWALGNMGPEGVRNIRVTVEVADEGVYENQCQLAYRVGLNDRQVVSNVATTYYGPDHPLEDFTEAVEPGPDAGDDLVEWLDIAEESDLGEGDVGSPDATEPVDDTSAGDIVPDAPGEGGDGVVEDDGGVDFEDTFDGAGVRSAAEEGCGCTNTPHPSAKWSMGFLALLVVGLRRKRAP